MRNTIACAVCGEPCELVYYKSLEEHNRDAYRGSVWLGVNWGPGWRACYFDLADDVDFCSAECSLNWETR